MHVFMGICIHYIDRHLMGLIGYFLVTLCPRVTIFVCTFLFQKYA